eukprot:8657239-Pyramimonas_sp.AAC.1
MCSASTRKCAVRARSYRSCSRSALTSVISGARRSRGCWRQGERRWRPPPNSPEDWDGGPARCSTEASDEPRAQAACASGGDGRRP